LRNINFYRHIGIGSLNTLGGAQRGLQIGKCVVPGRARVIRVSGGGIDIQHFGRVIYGIYNTIGSGKLKHGSRFAEILRK
jgi:hypothetical protein